MSPIFGDTAQTYWQRVALMKSLAEAEAIQPSSWYDMLEEYYLNNGLYDDVTRLLHENAIWTANMKPLRNPAHRAVEFYVSKLWPGPLERALPILNTKKEAIRKAILQIWTWSNLASQKQVLARWFPNFGDMFIKVAEKSEGGQVTRVYHDPIKPRYVTDLEHDERGFVTYIRIDVPTEDETWTEVWSKTRGGYRLWKHNRSLSTPIDQLGTPANQKTFDELGFNFIPIVHAKFQDIGETRGVGCFVHVLDKIDEANRQATRLHEILFRYNKPTQAVSANAMDASGKPLPPPVIQGRDNTSSKDGSVSLGDDDIFSLPGMSKLEQMVPNLQYDAALNILNAQMEEISRDLPEILYYELKEKADLSGVALQRLLGAAIDRVQEARGNAEEALIRANQMALTIAGIHNLEGFEDLGTFEDGDFVHTFAERDVIPLSTKEKAEAVKADTDAGLPLTFSLKKHGYSQEEIKEITESEEYRLHMDKLLWEAVSAAEGAGIPIEAYLRRLGWTNEQLQDLGTQKLAAIKLKQEDKVPPVRQ